MWIPIRIEYAFVSHFSKQTGCNFKHHAYHVLFNLIPIDIFGHICMHRLSHFLACLKCAAFVSP